MIRRFPLFAVVLAGLCLLGYLTVDTTGLNVRLLVVVFWLAFICSLVALLLVRRKRLLPQQFDVGETRNSGGILSSVFEVETEKFSFIACARCGFTEFYRCDRNVLRAIFDLEIG